MTSSNKASRKVRTRTWISIALAISIFVSLGYLFVEVSRQSAEFGEIKANYDDYVKKTQLAGLEYRSNEKALAQLMANLTTTRNELSQVTAELTNKTVLLEDKIQISDELIKRIETEEKRLGDLRIEQKELETVEALLSKRLQELDKLKTNISRYDEDLKSVKSKLSKENAELESVKANLDDLEDKESVLKAQVDKQRADLKLKTKENRDLGDDAAQTKKIIEVYDSELDEVRKALNSEKPELEKVRSDLLEMRSQIDVAQRDLDAKRSDAAAEESRQRNLKSLADIAEARLENAQSDLTGVLTALSDEKPELEKVRSDLDEFRALIAGKLKLTKELEAQIIIKETLLNDMGDADNNNLPESGGE